MEKRVSITASVLMLFSLMLAVDATLASEVWNPYKYDAYLAKPIKIHDDGKFEWWIRKAWAYEEYKGHRSDVEDFFPLPEKIHDWYVENLGGGDKMNFKIKFVLDTPGGGYASIDEVGIAIDAFWSVKNNVKGWWAYLIMTHEFGNLYTSNVLSGGWPCDWWADHGVCPAIPGFASPAPGSFALTALQEIDWQDSAQVSRVSHDENQNDKLLILFRDRLIGRYGVQMFARMFSLLREDEIIWSKIDGGKLPSPLVTNYVAAYMSLGAGTSLSGLLNEYVDKPYGEGIPAYDSKSMEDIMAARRLIYRAKEQGKDVSRAWEAYRKGDYRGASYVISQVCTDCLDVKTDDGIGAADKETLNATMIDEELSQAVEGLKTTKTPEEPSRGKEDVKTSKVSLLIKALAILLVGSLIVWVIAKRRR